MKIGIVGFENSGKKTIFELLTGRQVDNAKYRSEKQAISASSEVLDARFDKIADIYNTKKRVRATIEFQLLQPLEKSSVTDREVMQNLKAVDAICLIARQFKDDSVYHIDGGLDPYRDIEWFTSEIVLNDLVLVDTRITRLEEEIKKRPSKEKDDVRAAHVLPLLYKLKEHLEKGLPLRAMSYAEEEEKILATYQFLSDKCLIVVLNMGEEDIKNNSIVNDLSKKFENQKIFLLQLSAKIEKELASLSKENNVGDAYMRSLLKEYGIEKSALSALTQISYKALGLITFFTASVDEVRSWTARINSRSPQAAKSIHKDMEKGFIRAEVMKSADLIALGNEKKVREAGKFYVKGADYIVEDGDIFHVLFNV